jgi:hypothetical protein
MSFDEYYPFFRATISLTPASFHTDGFFMDDNFGFIMRRMTKGCKHPG